MCIPLLPMSLFLFGVAEIQITADLRYLMVLVDDGMCAENKVMWEVWLESHCCSSKTQVSQGELNEKSHVDHNRMKHVPFLNHFEPNTTFKQLSLLM